MPDLESQDLQDQHFVRVVVGRESLGRGRGDVDIDLYGKVQLDLDRVRQRRNRAHLPPHAVPPERVAVGEVVANAVNIEAAVDESIAAGTALFVSSPA